jgi:hypothetical protein
MEAFAVANLMRTCYVIRRLDSGWYWLGANVWTEKAQDARTFEFVTDAELVGSKECPLPLAEWEVVEVEGPKRDRSGATMKHRNVTFDNKTIALDNQEFNSCTFRNCRLIYSGGKPPVLDTCSFVGSSLIFAASAGETLNFMRVMYHRGFQNLIDTTVNHIRHNGYPGQWGGTVHSEEPLVS